MNGNDFRLADSKPSSPFAPPPVFPFGGELMLCGWEKFLVARCSGSIDVSDVVDELVEFAELPSKLSFDVCECG